MGPFSDRDVSYAAEVYTKTNDDASWRACWYDYDELADEPNFELPEETTRQPPWFELPDTGTIIAMRKVDLREFGSPQKLHGTSWPTSEGCTGTSSTRPNNHC